jgi:hypothetical protein
MSPKQGAMSLLAGEDHEEFFEQLFVLDKMGKDEVYCSQLVEAFRSLKNK